MTNRTVKTPETLRAGQAFMLKGDHKRYTITSAHRDGDVSYARESDVYVEGIRSRFIVDSKVIITRVSRDELDAEVSKFVESKHEEYWRLREEEALRLREARALADELAVAYPLAVMENLLFDCAKSGDLVTAVERMANFLEEERETSHERGRESGLDAFYDSSY